MANKIEEALDLIKRITPEGGDWADTGTVPIDSQEEFDALMDAIATIMNAAASGQLEVKRDG
jgi:hypothetical protein